MSLRHKAEMPIGVDLLDGPHDLRQPMGEVGEVGNFQIPRTISQDLGRNALSALNAIGTESLPVDDWADKA